MSKVLTEKWKDGTLIGGIYYCESKSFGEKKLSFHHKANGEMYAQTYGQEEYYPDEDVVEVLAPVPSYKELQKLKEQLKEANEIIRSLQDARSIIVDEYIKNWGVK